ncbi:MAG: cyclopropane fatty acyl phospholipid synthase [candidate division KSB1 bacterium]|nr:cyclopropane fatty acyl phospholipid synthase [candidate division KSB1 bacterium]MDZ7300627.1 cyclopropane fatty acyl phospholipid synthase [candidate division KSB1 bacterium]MDZ7309764.1 cyclopropane fatty acyl phospholipid synthase [candidate division KSB1 bacterium]
MTKDQAEVFLRELLSSAGITINGNNPFDLQVHNQQFYQRVLREGALGLGESYMDGWWDCQALDQFFDRILRANLEKKVKGNLKTLWPVLKSKLFNLQKPSRAYQVGEEHYDLGNDLYQAMLDKRLNYTCGYWKNAKNLDEAQEAKLELVCKKIDLEPGMTVLELGCGFGSFAGYAAEKYGVKVTGVTVSKEQVELGNKLYHGLPVELKLEDYRNVSGKYDRVISIGIMEHVGYKNYRTYMEVVDRTLKDDGVAFIHTIGGNVSTTTANAWTTKYIFPNGMLPSVAQLGKAMEGLLVMEDWHNFGPDYDKTLMAWHDNFEKAWPDLKEKYGERFRRMWRYYLLSSAGGFRSRSTQLWQIVMTKPGRKQPNCRL